MTARVAAIEARGREIAAECPSALTYAPRDAEFEELIEATEMSLVYAALAPVRSATLRLAHTIAQLSWSSGRLTRFVHSLVIAERSSAALALPDICGDIAAWRMSGYTTLQPSVTGFIARVYKIESGVGPSEESLGAVILHLLRPYEDPAERRTFERSEQLEERADKRLAAIVTFVGRKLAAALGVSAL